MKKLIATLLLATALAACGGENGNTAANKPQPKFSTSCATRANPKTSPPSM